MGVWREEDHPRGEHGHFISKVAAVGSAILDATKAAGSVVIDRAKQLGIALIGQVTVVPAAFSVFSSTFFARLYQRPTNEGARARADYGIVPVELTSGELLPPWLLPVSVETWNHILDGHSPESTDQSADKFVDGSTAGIVAVVLNAVQIAEPELKYGDRQRSYSTYNGQAIRIFLEYVPGSGRWELTSVHPFTGDSVIDFLNSRR